MERRGFIKSAIAAGVAAARSSSFGQTDSAGGRTEHPRTRPSSPDMQYRELGTTGEKVSAIGLGGFHIGKQPTAAESIQIIRTAIDKGSLFSTIPGITTRGSVKCGWARRYAMDTATRSF